MTIRSYFGKQNSTLRSVVPLAYFLFSHMWWKQSSFMNIIIDAVADCSGQTLNFFYSQRLLFPSFLFFSSIIFALGLKEPSSVSAGLKPLMNWCLYAWKCTMMIFQSYMDTRWVFYIWEHTTMNWKCSHHLFHCCHSVHPWLCHSLSLLLVIP